MKVRDKRWQAVLVALTAALLASCATKPSVREIIFDDQMTQLQARSIQSRTFEFTDRIKAMRAAIVTLGIGRGVADLPMGAGRVKSLGWGFGIAS